MIKLFREYKSMLKPLPVEGIPDLFLFRPLAFFLVKIAAHSPITPNQLSVTALATGLASAFCFSRGTPRSFLWAGLLYGATAMIDCSDGMLARYKKNGTPIGRIIDGSVDYLNGTAIFLGLGIGVSKMTSFASVYIWTTIFVAATSMALHSILVDFFRGQFFIHALKIKHSINDEITVFNNELRKLKQAKAGILRQYLIKIYLLYCRIQLRLKIKPVEFNAQKYHRNNTIMLRLWLMIELSMHICMLMLAAFLYKPEIFFLYTIVFSNIWMVLLVPLQIIANNRSK